jgi:hypothetical protein
MQNARLLDLLAPPTLDAQVCNAEAIAFYEKFGFKITETIAGTAYAPSCVFCDP